MHDWKLEYMDNLSDDFKVFLFFWSIDLPHKSIITVDLVTIVYTNYSFSEFYYLISGKILFVWHFIRIGSD